MNGTPPEFLYTRRDTRVARLRLLAKRRRADKRLKGKR